MLHEFRKVKNGNEINVSSKKVIKLKLFFSDYAFYLCNFTPLEKATDEIGGNY